MSKFVTDSQFERASIAYLESHKLFEQIGIKNYRFTDSAEEQKAGSDLIGDIVDGDTVIPNQVIDVKSIAGFIPTFSQEIINGTSQRVGWIMNGDLNTDYYLFVWHQVENPTGYGLDKARIVENPETITKNRLCLVSKERLVRFIEQATGVKCSKENASAIWSAVSNFAPEDKKTSYFSLEDGMVTEIENGKGHRIYITRSNVIHERPLNFIIREPDLKALGRELVI